MDGDETSRRALTGFVYMYGGDDDDGAAKIKIIYSW